MKKNPIKKAAAGVRGGAGAGKTTLKKGGRAVAGMDMDRLQRKIKELSAELKRKDRELKLAQGGPRGGALQDNSPALKAMVDGSPIPQFMIGRDHRVLYWNRALEATTGIRAKDVIGTKDHWRAFYLKRRPTLSDILLDRKIKRIREWYGNKCRKSRYVTGAYEGVDYFPRKGREGVWLFFTAVVIKDNDGAVTGALETLEDITDRMQAQEALRKSEERFRHIAESTEEWIWEFDSKGLFTYSNAVVKKILGYRPEDIIGKKHFYEFVITEKKEEMMKTIHEYFAAKKPFYKNVNRNVHKNGSTVILEESGIPFLNSKGELVGYRGVATNITGRVRAEEALRKSELHYRLLAENVSDVIIMLDTNLRQTYISPSVRRLRGYEPEEVMRQDISEIITPESQARLDTVFEKGRADAESGHDSAMIIDIEELRKDGSTVWVEMVTNPMRDDNGRHIGYMCVVRNISERRRLTRVLQESEERYRLLVENAGEVIVVAQKGMLKYANAMATRAFGFSTEELYSRPFLEFIHPEDRPMVADRYQQRQMGLDSPDMYQFRVLHKDGGFRWVEITVVNFSWEGSFATLNFMKDITDRKRIGDALHESERKYRELVENANSIILRMDMDGTVTFFNEFAQEFFGFTLDEILGRNIVGTIVPEVDSSGNDQKILMKNLLRETEKFKNNENENIKKSGERVWISWTNKVVRVIEGNAREILCIGNDITSQKKAQEELLKSEIKFRELADFLPELLFELDSRGNFTYVNRVAYTSYGYTPEDLTGGMNLLDVVIPEDRDRTIEKFKSILKGSWLTGNEYSVRRKDGSMVPVIIHGRSIVHNGTISGVRGIAVDITERKKAETALRESEEKFRRLFEDSGTAQFLVDGGIFVDCNNEAMNLLGCGEKSRIVLKSIIDFAPEMQPDGESSRVKVEKLAKSAMLEKSVTQEFEYRRLDGKMLMAEIVVTAIPMTGKDVFHASVRDITEQKRLQNEIINIIDVEQQRLGRDLHDGLGQDLTGMAFMCNTLAKNLKERGVPEAAFSEEITAEVYRIITRVRMLSRELYPTNLIDNEITYTLEQLAANISSIFGIHCTFHQDPDLFISNINVSTQIYYIVREAVNNAVKHGHAGHIKISLTREKNNVILAIEDDGIGQPDKLDRHKGLGLRIIAYRMTTINGTFAIKNGMGRGVQIYCTFPEYEIRDTH